MAQDKPCVGVSSLEAMAYNLPGAQGVICCAMDARCGQVYTALFRFENGALHRLLPDSAMAIEALGAVLAQYTCPVTFVGDGAKLCFDALSSVVGQAALAPENLRFPRASGAAEAARQGSAQPCTAAELSVSYLRLSQAERERKEKLEAEKQ